MSFGSIVTTLQGAMYLFAILMLFMYLYGACDRRWPGYETMLSLRAAVFLFPSAIFALWLFGGAFNATGADTEYSFGSFADSALQLMRCCCVPFSTSLYCTPFRQPSSSCFSC